MPTVMLTRLTDASVEPNLPIVTSIGSLMFLEIARKVKVLVKLIRKNPYACLKKNTTRATKSIASNSS